MAVSERDPYTGKLTTGHDWNGIKELDTPIPRIVLLFLAVAGAFAIIWTILMPAWPTLNGYSRGLLGTDQRSEVQQNLSEIAAERATWTSRIESESFADIQADPALMKVVRETGAALFGDNCAACHGVGGTGGPGFPNIAQAPTLWGDDPDTLLQTISHGINSVDPDARYSQMLAFGRDQMLTSQEIRAVATFVRSLSDPTVTGPDGAGAQIFADNCASCHGEDGTGMVEAGAPNLTDAFWIYGGDEKTIRQTIHNGRQGVMPAWAGRLSPLDLKLLVLYVLDLRGKQT